MIFSLTWLPGVLREAGLKVAVVDGWETRGRGDVSTIVGVICHHTGGPRTGNMPSLDTLIAGRIAGRNPLPGPLAQLGLGRDGTYYVIAAGKCNHAGDGSWQGVATGNASFIGIEGENSGAVDDPWPAVQMDAYRRGVAAILNRIGRGAEFCAGHKEYALPRGRKPDPLFEMEAFRSSVARIIRGDDAPPVLIPGVEPPTQPNGAGGRPTLRRGAMGDQVKAVQAKVGVGADGFFGPKTEAAVRAFQRAHDLVPDGIVGPKTWRALDGA
jgi:peptidoglycan hydrolase-like protein with peptidoglycan-binding domain